MRKSLIVSVVPVFVCLAVSQLSGSGAIVFLSSLRCAFRGSFLQYSKRCSGVWCRFLHRHCLVKFVDGILLRYELV